MTAPKPLQKYFWPGRSIPFYLVLAVVLAVCFLFAHYSGSNYRSYLVEFVIETEQPVEFAIYYDIGRGYNEIDHQSVEVEEPGSPTAVRFCIPAWSELRKIRFDPAREHAIMSLYSITIVHDDDRTFQVPLATVEAHNQILHHEYDGERLFFETEPEGDDPMFVLTAIRDWPAARPWREPRRYLLWMAAGLAACFTAIFIHRFFLRGL